MVYWYTFNTVFFFRYDLNGFLWGLAGSMVETGSTNIDRSMNTLIEIGQIRQNNTTGETQAKHK